VSEAEAILEELRANRAVMEEILRRLGEPRALQSDILTLDEAASLLRLRPASLRRGLAGTHRIPRHTSHPVTFRRAEVERFIRDRAERAREAKDAGKRLSLVRRRKSA
jgi:hypothetical protein